MSSKVGSSSPTVKSRRRDEALMSAIRDATRAELADFGYGGVTFEGVARRAQTSKPVLYRRFSSRAHMVVDALPTLQWQPEDGFTWTRSLRDDLLLVFGIATEKIRAVGADNYRSLVAEADADLLGTLDTMVTSLAERTILPALDRARQRGELGPRQIPRRAALSIGVLVRNEMLFSRDELDDNVIAEIIDTVYLPLVTALSSRA